MIDPVESLSEMFQNALAQARVFSQGVLACLVILYAASGSFFVSPNEIAVHQRFGKVIHENVPPGIHYAFPWPVDRITKVPVREVKRMVIDDFYHTRTTAYDSPGLAGVFSYITGLESYCITGDNNLVNIRCVIQYTISRPADYLFSIRDPEIMLRSLACKTIIHSLARMPIDDILTRGKQAMAGDIMQDLQKKLDNARTGIHLSFVELDRIRPPQRVDEYFSDVVKASIDSEKRIHDAQSYQNNAILEARGNAARTKEAAKAYQSEAVLTAQGRASRFKALLSRAETEKNNTDQLIYSQAVQDILENIGSVTIIDSDAHGHPAASLKIRSR